MAQQGETANHIVRAREASPALATAALAGWLRRRWISCRSHAARLRDLLVAWRQDAAEQRYLADLSDYYLKDMGLSRDDVAHDSTRSFWRR